MKSTWIWMKDEEKALREEVLPPVHPLDDRLVVKDLITKHRDAIDTLQASLKEDPLYDPTKHDDLWILRFVLSHKRKHKAALKAMKHTFQFRQKYKLDEDDIRFHVPGHESAKCSEMKAMLKYADEDTFTWCLPMEQGHVFAFVRFAGYDQNNLVANLDESYWLPCFIYLAEWAHQWCDYITRTTGRLTKNVRLIDFDGMSFSQVNRELSKRDSNAMKVTEDVYPQLLQTVMICHGPAWMQALWRMFRPLLPKRMVEKVDFIHPVKNEKERDRLLHFVPLSLLPKRFGGEYEPWPVQFSLPNSSWTR